MTDDATQQIAQEHQLPVGEVSFSSSESKALAYLIGTSGINCTWVIENSKEKITWTIGRGAKAEFKTAHTTKLLR